MSARRGDSRVAAIQLRNVTKRWGDFVGVDNFHLTIGDREFLVLLGPSGCGKTTTMRMVAGLEEATDGNIVIGGRVVNDLDPKDRDIAMVFQSYGLYPNMNTYENIRFPLKVRKVDPATHDERVRRAAAMVELTEFLHRKPAELSGGPGQRVALARAIVREPTVFLMDEPLSNLDAKLRVSTRAQIKNLQHELVDCEGQQDVLTLEGGLHWVDPDPLQGIRAFVDILGAPGYRGTGALGVPPPVGVRAGTVSRVLLAPNRRDHTLGSRPWWGMDDRVPCAGAIRKGVGAGMSHGGSYGAESPGWRR